MDDIIDLWTYDKSATTHWTFLLFQNIIENAYILLVAFKIVQYVFFLNWTWFKYLSFFEYGLNTCLPYLINLKTFRHGMMIPNGGHIFWVEIWPHPVGYGNKIHVASGQEYIICSFFQPIGGAVQQLIRATAEPSSVADHFHCFWLEISQTIYTCPLASYLKIQEHCLFQTW